MTQYIGNISYSLYLWHFPVVILGSAYLTQAAPSRIVALGLGAVVFSVLSFHFVEDPIRRSNWLARKKSATASFRYQNCFPSEMMKRLGGGGLVALAITVALLVHNVENDPGNTRAIALSLQNVQATTGASGAEVPTPITGSPSTAAPAAQSLQSQWSSRIDDALTATSFPDLNPSVDDLPQHKAPQWTQNDCGTTGAWNATLCVYGNKDARKTAAVFDDSIALSYLPGLIKALNDHGYLVHSFVAGSCPGADVAVVAEGTRTVSQSCLDHRKWAMSAIASVKPDLIIAADSDLLMNNLVSRAAGQAMIEEWTQGDVRTWSQLAKVAKTVVLASPPGSKSLLDCRTVNAAPDNCALETNSGPTRNAARQAESAASKQTSVPVVDTSKWFCGTDGRCPSFVGTVPVYVDGIHLTRAYSASLAPLMSSALQLPV